MPVETEGAESVLDEQAEGSAPVVPEEVLPTFDPQYQDDFVGLTFVGAVAEEFEWLGHKFVIRTLTTDEYLAVATLTKDYINTTELPRAYATAIASLCIETVDGEALPVPIAEEKRTYAWAFQRFNYVKGQWYPYTISKVYDKYIDLERRVEQVLESMGNASGWTESQTPGLNANSV
jgi:hypothetical protein